MDTTDIAIINELKDGRISFKKIAQTLGLAEGTVRSRVKRLRTDGQLDITGLVDQMVTNAKIELSAYLHVIVHEGIKG